MRYAQLRDERRDEKFVLVVDDDTCTRESLSELLDTKGYTVLQAENGQIALDVSKKCLIAHV
jgi:CheY-like chemotaxis protein